MNQYIQKYGDNAIQAYKKSLRLSESLQKDQTSPIKQQPHLLPKKSLSKRSLKSHISKRNDSQSKLVHSKSIKSGQKFQDDSRKKGSSFIDSNKRAVIASSVNGFGHTFSKLGVNLNGNKKKLVITQSNTPKYSTPKMHINLNLHQNKNQQKNNNLYQNENRDKLTERIQRSSGKKNGDKCSTSQSKHQTKRSFLGSIESRLQEMVISNKGTLRSLGLGMRECFDILLMNEEDIKLRKVFLLIKEIFEKVYELGEKYKNKYTKANQKIHSMQVIHQTYLINNNQSNQQHGGTKSKVQAQSSKSNKTQSSIEAIIMNQNYELRRKVNKLEKQLEYYTSQNASLNNVFGKFKNSEFNSNQDPRNDLYRHFYHHQNDHSHNQNDHSHNKKQYSHNNQNKHSHNNKEHSYNNQNKHSQKKNKHSSGYKQMQQSLCNNNFQKRRSSQNLLQNQVGQKGFSYGIQKRLSFDPGLLESGSEMKKKINNNSNKYGSIGLNSMYNSVGPSENNYSEHNLVIYNEEHQLKRLNREHQVQELSEQEDSQNE